MELFKLSKFKLQLQALVTEVRELRAREHSAQEQIDLSAQKHKQVEEEFMAKIKGLQIKLADSKEDQQKLERKVSSLESDNSLLENKQKELKETINNLLQSKENFVKVYEDTTCELKQAVLTRDRKCAVLSEKLNSHISLFDAISKETSFVKQVLDTVQSLVTEKEGIVAGLRAKMDRVSSFEKAFVEKISYLENKLSDAKNELRKKDKKISELEAQLENAVITNMCQRQIELQTTLSMKDVVIEDLQSEKKVLQSELRSLSIILEKIQLAFTIMNDKVDVAFAHAFPQQKAIYNLVYLSEKSPLTPLDMVSPLGTVSQPQKKNLAYDRNAYTSALEGQEEHIYDKEKQANCLEVCVLSSSEEHLEVKENEANRFYIRANDKNHSVSESSTNKGSEIKTEAKPDSICGVLDSVAKPMQGNNPSDSSLPVATREL